MESVVSIRGVTKRYGKQAAVDRVSFEVRKGSIFGLLGPNGAGKTSTIRMLTGITLPDEGIIELFGQPIKAEHQNNTGYMPEERGLYRKLPVRMQLEYLGMLKGMPLRDARRSVDLWLDKFELRSWEKKKTNELSKGMQQKLQFIVTVLHDPQLLILDEPLSGLDPINAELINSTITEFKQRGKTIILSTHRMEQVEQVCDDIVLMNNGGIILEGELREVKRRSGRNIIALRFHGDATFLHSLLGIKILEQHPNEALMEVAVGTDLRAMLGRVNSEVELLKWERVEPPLKELFLEAVSLQSPTI
jgi:ABC-2 type transport system ATP-binding protein